MDDTYKTYSVTVPGITLAPSQPARADRVGFWRRLTRASAAPKKSRTTTFVFGGIPPGTTIYINDKPFFTIPTDGGQ